MKLLLTSFEPNAEQEVELAKLIGKEPKDTTVAVIENAYDVYNDEASLVEAREGLTNKGYNIELVDLRKWKEGDTGLREILSNKDMFYLYGGNGFYLRWIMRESGADEIITELVKKGIVYVGASAAAVLVGPTLHFFETLDDPHAAKEIVWDGLGLIETVVVPHIDNKEFGEECRKANEKLTEVGYVTQPLADSQALLINGDERRVI